MKPFFLEVCVDSLESALAAEAGGADRLELCANLVIGGTTPGSRLFEQIKEKTNLPVRVLIRPRFGDFCYTSAEIEQMEEDVRHFSKTGADGIVIGCLLPDGELEQAGRKRLIGAAAHCGVTLHRAFDVCRNPERALYQAESLGVDTILTSGQEGSAEEGINLINRLRSMSRKVEIMAGGGICSETVTRMLPAFFNNPEILDRPVLFHMSGKKVADSPMQYRNYRVSMGMPGISEFERWKTSEREVRKVREILEQWQKN